MKRVWCVGAWANNVGDRILQKANSDLIKDNYTYCDFTYINCQQTYFSPELIEYMNKSADILFIAGGGLIFNRPQDRSNSGWQWNIKTQDIQKIKIPIVVNAVGYNKFPHDGSGFKSCMWDNVQETIDKAKFFSVRNTGTLNTLIQNGINTSNVRITPDCGMFIRPEEFNHHLFNTVAPKIGLNWATDRIEQRFGPNWVNKLDVVLDACRFLADKYGAIVYLIEHLMPNELNESTKKITRERFKQKLSGHGVVLFEDLNQELYPMFDYNAGFFADIYKKMDLVFGMRGHAGIVSFGMETPFIGIGQHNKVKWFMEDVGLSDSIISLNGTDEEDLDNLKNMATLKLENRDINKCIINMALNNQRRIQKEWFGKITRVFLE